MSQGIGGKYVKTYAPGSSENLAILKIDELVAAYNKLQGDYAALRAKFVAVLAKLDADTGVTDVNYAATQTPAATASAQVTKSASDLLIKSPVKEGV